MARTARSLVASAAALACSPWALAQAEAQPAPQQTLTSATEAVAAERPPETGGSGSTITPPSPSNTAAPDGTQSDFHLTFAAEITSAYYFRGIRQEDRGFIVQPTLTVSYTVLKNDTFSVTLDAGTWNSFHDRATGAGSNSDFDDKWYECDLFGGVTFAAGKWSLRTFYTWYSSPNGAFREVHEIAGTLAYDDSDLLGAFALHPSLTIAHELGPNGADGPGKGDGTYLELGLTPGFDILSPGDQRGWGLRLNFPQVLGVSLANYYENDAGKSQTFGFYETGARLIATAPSRGSVTFSFWGGVRALFLGDATREFNRHRESTQVIGVVGASVGF
jgi:hypothetical protein